MMMRRGSPCTSEAQSPCLCRASQETWLDTVSTTCGSGWVTDQVYETFAGSSALYFVPTRYRRWYWLCPSRVLNFEAKPLILLDLDLSYSESW